MGDIGQLYALPLGKILWLWLARWLKWATELVWTLWKKD